MAKVQKLYLLLPNHKCPNKKNCPFHPPEDEEEELEEAEMTMPAKRRAMSLAAGEDKIISEKLLAEKLARINQDIASNLQEGNKLHLPRKTSHDISMPTGDLERLRADSMAYFESSTATTTTATLANTREESVASDYESTTLTLDSGVMFDSCSDLEEESLPLIQEEIVIPDLEIPEELQLKNGEEVAMDDRHVKTLKDGEATLQISELTTEDGAEYTCQAVNSHGEAETSATLTVEEVRHRRKRMEDEEASIRFMRPAHEYDMTDVDTNVAPEFTLPLVDQSRAVGDQVTFTVTVTCRPEPDVTWYHGDQKVSRSSRVSFHHEKGVYRMTVLDLNAKDAGEWRCQAYNSYGEAWCSCDLNVIEIIPPGHTSPRFSRELEYMTVSEGSLVRLECQVTGEPKPKLKWYKDRRRIDTDGHYKIRTLEDGTSTLVVEGVTVVDTGSYMVQAENDAGSATTEARMKVQKVYEAPPTQELISAPRDGRAAPISGTLEYRKVRAEVPPDFTAKLKNKRAPEGSTVRLNCSVTGIPEPQVRWFRDGQEIFDGHDYTMRNNYGLLSLEIVYAKQGLAGKYTVQASNSEGTVDCSCLLEVEGDEEISSMELDILRPKFSAMIEDITVNEGEDAVFTCTATGKPMPTFKWQRDMIPLSGSRNVEMEYDNQGHASLTLRKVKPSDAGLYYCVALSRSGRTKCSARLHVKAKSPSPMSPRESVEYRRFGSRDLTSIERGTSLGAPASFALMLPKSLDVVEGERLKLDCSVMGLPAPMVTWHKGDRELVYSQRHRIILCGTLHTMEIPSTMSRDRGDYIVRATNAFGTVESACFVNVLPKGSRVTTPPDYRRDAMRDAAKASTQAPFFIKHLPKTIDVMAGIDVRLDCILRRGIELVRWSSSPTPPEEAEKARKELADEGFEGEFIPTRPSPPREETAPTEAASRLEHPSFPTTPQDLVRPVGGEAVFECTTAGTPEPEVKWYKDGRVLIGSDSVRMTSSGNRHRLKIKAILRSDQGEYTCKAKSIAGTKTCGATLNIADDSSAPRPSTHPQPVEEEDQTQSSVDTTRSAAPREDKPSFSQSLPKTTDAVSGSDVALTCRIRGQAAEVTWELNNEPLPKEARYFVSYDTTSDLHCLTLTGVTETDSAKFTCVAKLADGDLIHTSTKLHVTAAADSTQAEEEQDFKPKFTSGLTDTTVGDGEGLELTCEIEGNPRPQISWFRDGVEIFDSQDFQISMIGSHCKLQISDMYPEDEGEYACTAVNSLGEVTTSCYVAVEAPA